MVVSPDTPEPHQWILRSSFQIVAFRDNYVKFQRSTDMEINPNSVQEYYTWVDLGSAHDIGLNWTESQLFGFRCAAELYTHADKKAIEPFDVSGIKWFRLEAVFGL